MAIFSLAVRSRTVKCFFSLDFFLLAFELLLYYIYLILLLLLLCPESELHSGSVKPTDSGARQSHKPFSHTAPLLGQLQEVTVKEIPCTMG